MIDKDKIVIERVFDAPVEKVWQAWTDPKMVAKWWGPEGFTAPSIKIDLRVGGKYTYAMQGPKGSQWDKVMYSSGVFKKIADLNLETLERVIKIAEKSPGLVGVGAH
mgnify:CR=1 FL=1